MKKQFTALFAMLTIAIFSTAFAGGHNAEKLLMEVQIPEKTIELHYNSVCLDN